MESCWYGDIKFQFERIINSKDLTENIASVTHEDAGQACKLLEVDYGFHKRRRALDNELDFNTLCREHMKASYRFDTHTCLVSVSNTLIIHHIKYLQKHLTSQQKVHLTPFLLPW